MDYLRLTWGTPLVVYNQVDDPQVSPRQHICRALGGPVFNLLVAPLAWLLRRRTAPGTWQRDVANIFLGTNLFLPLVGMLPIPALDGGPVLKWTLVARGRSREQAWRTVRAANTAGAVVAGTAGALALSRRRWGTAALLLQFAGLMAAYAIGWLRE
jgi:Zn-dependent protease